MTPIQTEHTTSLKHIFLHNENWLKIYQEKKHLMRPSIISSVTKMLICKTETLGYNLFQCFGCGKQIMVYHTCKSRFCPSCGKKATDEWITTKLNALPACPWQHITFTMPDKFWLFFWYNRELQNIVPGIAANILLELGEEKGFKPGLFAVIHTFGSMLNRNFHIHLSTSCGGLDTNNLWKKGHFHHHPIKKRWRARIISMFREHYKSGNLKLPYSLKHLNTYQKFNQWLQQFFRYDWNIEVQKPNSDKKQNIEYLGRYIKRPALGETRIKEYDGKTVTFEYMDRHDNTKKITSLPVKTFIERLICHIPDKGFRLIRYYGVLANRVISKLLPLMQKAFELFTSSTKTIRIKWQDMIKRTFGYDPLLCPSCKSEMELIETTKPMRSSDILLWIVEIAKGQHPKRVEL